MAIRKAKIEALALDLLQRCNEIQAPIDVERIALALGLIIRYEALQDSSLSGFLFREGEQNIIGVNADHSETRQRFTIAHEIGHYVLHGSSIHVDHAVHAVFKRDQRASEGVYREEIEANTFAAALLMPKSLLECDIQCLPDGVDVDDARFEIFAKRTYKVSPQAMTHRLTSLGYINNI